MRDSPLFSLEIATPSPRHITDDKSNCLRGNWSQLAVSSGIRHHLAHNDGAALRVASACLVHALYL